MSFRFNFGNSANNNTSCEATDKEERVQPHEGVEHVLEAGRDLSNIKCVSLSNGVRHVDVAKEMLGESDLVTGVYEGGFKVWEASLDLMHFLMNNDNELKDIKNVLELGCGAALPSLYLMNASKGKIEIHLQDYNEDVMKECSMINVLLNCDKEFSEINNKPRFFSGDWGKVIDLLPSRYYDLILSSETIYNVENQPKLMNVIDKCLSDDGKVLLAAKIHYFGVGGGLRQFEMSLDSHKWSYRTVFKVDEGVKREIIEIKRISKNCDNCVNSS